MLPEREVTPDVIGEAVGRRQLLGDDDGFESLNGKSSSGEEYMAAAQRRSDLNDTELETKSPANNVKSQALY